MTKLEFRWPDAAEETVRAARGKLSVASGRIRQIPFDERLKRIARVLESWTAPDSPFRRELISSLAANDSPFDERTLAEGINSALRAWEPAAFTACANRELGSILTAPTTRLAPFETISMLTGGALPMPTISSVLFSLVVGSPVLLREKATDSVTGELLTRSLQELDEELATGLEIVRFPREDEAAMAEFLASPCVVATGSDETIERVRSRLAPSQRLVAYGHRFSIAVFGSEISNRAMALEEAVAGLALDIARWDQSGCLSPSIGYLVGFSFEERNEAARQLAAQLELTGRSYPRGPRTASEQAAETTERAEARMRAAVNDSAALFENPDSTVILESDASPRPAPLGRMIRLHPVESPAELSRVLAPHARHLSNAAVAGFSDRGNQDIRFLLETHGINRITRPGRLQTPPIDWPHDGLPVFLPMARFVQSEI